MFDYFTLDNFNVYNKVVVVRVDLDSLMVNGRVSYSEKFQRACRTIRELSQKGAKVVILIRQDMFKFQKKSLQESHLKLIEQEINYNKNIKVQFSKSSTSIISKISKLKLGQVLLCEHIDSFEEEELISIIKKAQIYVIDTFSELYKQDEISISIQLLEDLNIPILVGRSLEREILHLQKTNILKLGGDGKNKEKNQVMYVLGGVKLKEEIEYLGYILQEQKVQKILLSGLIGELALYIEKVPMGKKSNFFKEIEEDSLTENIYNSNVTKLEIQILRNLIKKYSSKFVFPKDLALYSQKDKRVEISIQELKENGELQELVQKYEVLDIGMKTVNEFEIELQKSKVIVVKGSMGVFEQKEFEKGSKELLQIISKMKKQKFLLGGHTIAAAKMFNLLKKFNYVSFGGNTLFKILEKKKIEGFDLLKQNYKQITSSEQILEDIGEVENSQNSSDVKKSSKYAEFKDMRFYDFVSVGSNTLDIKVDVPEKFSQIEMGEKIKIKEGFKISNGGGGVNVSIALTKLHSKVGYLGKVSTEFKEILEKTLRTNKIDLVPSKETKKQVAKSILMQTKDGDRVIFTFRGQNDFLEFEDFESSLISSNNFYFTALNGKSMQTQIKLARKLKRINKNAIICYNPSMYLIKEEKRNLDKLIGLCDIIIFNFDEAKELTGDRDISSCLRSVYSKGVNLVVITDGSNGSYAYNGEEEYYQKSKEPRAVVDTTGAGDCFAGTFFYFYAKRYGIKASLQYASWNASALITKNGTQNGLLTFNELTKIKRA